MWDKIGVTLAVVLPFTGVILTIALKVINNKERKVLPECNEKFKDIDEEIKSMKDGSTDRQKIVIAIQAAIELLKENSIEIKMDYKDLFKSVNDTGKQIVEINQNIKYMAETIKEIKENGKKKHKE
jgi:methyl-accepting chemotaxis protein